MTMDATAHLFAALEARSPALAYEFEGERVTFAELDARARSYATALARAGVVAGDRVAVFVETRLELVVALFGNYYLGAIHVAINTRYREAEVGHILYDCQPAAIVCDGAGAEVLDAALCGAALAREPIRVGVGEGATGFPFSDLLGAEAGEYTRPTDDTPCLMVYTSGTTGPSKGVLHTHASVITNIRALTGLWTWSSRDRLVLALPLFHVHGLCIGVHGAAIHAMPVLLERRFDPAAVVARFADDERGRGTIFMGVPTMYAELVEHLRETPGAAAKLTRARLLTSGSAALSPELWHAFVGLTGQRILERYGMSETLLTLSNPYVGQRVPGSVGQPVPGCDAAVVSDDGAEEFSEVEAGETGELLVHSNGVMAGYWNQPEQTAASFVTDRDGKRWFRTGDVARVDEQGYFHLVGRKSVDIIKAGGFKISAREIEEVLADHESVREVAVVGVENAKWGQTIVACVVASAGEVREPGPDAQALLAKLVEHHRASLADFKKPRGLYLCESLPRNVLGKLQKHLLIEAIARDGLSASL